MGRVGNVGNKKFCLWPLRCRDLQPPALPGGPQPKAKSHGATSRQPYRTLHCSTLAGGNVGIAYIAYRVRAWGFRLAPGRPDVGNVGNVGNVFEVIKSLAKRRGLARKRPHIIQPYSYLTIIMILSTH